MAWDPYRVPPAGTRHGVNEPIDPPKPVWLTLRNGQRVAGMAHDQLRWDQPVGWRVRVTYDDEIGMTAGGWFGVAAIKRREPHQAAD